MNTPHALFWLNGKPCPQEDAHIPLLDHGLLYGDGVFEGIRLYQKQAFMLHEHLQRLADSARAIQLELPYTTSEFALAINTLTEQWPHAIGYLRLVVTRGTGSLGIDPKRCPKASAFIILSNVDIVDEITAAQGTSVIIAHTRRMPPDSLDPRIKSLNYMNNIQAKLEANRAGAHEAILLNHHGRVAEASAENVFIVKEGQLKTPPSWEGALEGITRHVVLSLAAQMGIQNSITPLTPFDLYSADECFLTGTGAELIAVKSIDQRPLAHCPGPIFQQLREAFKVFTQSPSRWSQLKGSKT